MNKAILEKFERKTEKCIEYLLFLSRYSDNYNIFEINSVLDRGYIGVGCLRRKKDQKMVFY